MRRLTHAARNGDADAQFNLGVLYDNRMDHNGYTIPGSRVEAIKWLLAAAEQGLPRAQIRLGEMYLEQPDNAGSHADACFWLLLAKDQLSNAHREQAQSAYDRVAAGLTPAQIAAVTKRAGLWRPKLSPAPEDLRPAGSRQRSTRL
jgi:TPR repeat protein